MTVAFLSDNKIKIAIYYIFFFFKVYGPLEVMLNTQKFQCSSLWLEHLGRGANCTFYLDNKCRYEFRTMGYKRRRINRKGLQKWFPKLVVTFPADSGKIRGAIREKGMQSVSELSKRKKFQNHLREKKGI